MSLIILALEIYQWMIIARAILSWVPSVPRYHPIVRFLHNVTEPVLAPLRRLLPPEKTGYIDFTPLLVFFFIGFLTSVLAKSVPPAIIR